MPNSTEPSTSEKRTKSPLDSGWRDFVLSVFAPWPFYPFVFYAAHLYTGQNGSPRDLTYWETFAMNGLALALGSVLKWFIKRQFPRRPEEENGQMADVKGTISA